MNFSEARLNGRHLHPRTFLNNFVAVDPSQFVNRNFGSELRRTEDGYLLQIPVPGFKQGEIDVTIEDGALTIAASNERRQLSRSMTLPENIDIERIKLEVELGELSIHLPLHPKPEPRKLDIAFK